MADGQYKFGIGLDTRLLQVDINEAKKMFESLTLATTKVGKGIDDSFVQPLVSMSAPLQQIPAQVNDASRSFNGLNIATQQLVRELPAASMGLNTLFLAMSNNLPIFADQVQNLRNEGQSMGNIFSMIGKSLWSWQTLLIAGITILSMYGKEIGNWVLSLFKGKKAVDAAKDAQKGLNDAIKKGGIDIGDEIVKYKELSETYKKLGDDMAAKKKFINDNKDAFHDLGVEIGNVNEANRLLINQTPAFIEALKLRAQASAAKGLAEKQYAIAAEKELEAQRVRNRGVNAWEKTVEWLISPRDGLFGSPLWTAKDVKNNRANNFQKEAEEARNLGDAYFELGEAKEELSKKFLKVIGVTPSDPYADYDAKALEDATRKLARDAEQARTDANIAAMRKDLKREIAAIESNYDAKKRAIADREKDMALMNKDGKLTAEQSAYFDTLYAANEQEHKREILEAQKREADKIAAMATTTRTLQLDAAQSEVDAMKEGEDKVLAEIDLKYRKRREQLENRQQELMKSQNGVLTGKQALMFGQMYENIDQEEANEIEEHNKKKLASFDDYLIEYGTIQEKILATTRKYEREIADAQSEGERKALAAERDAALAVYKAQVSDFAKGLADLSIKEINKMIKDLTAQVEAKQAAFDALDTSDSQEAQDYLKIINELKAKIQLLQNESDSAQRSLKDNNWAEATEVLQGISRNAQEAADALAPIDEVAASILSDFADAIDVVSGLTSAIKMLGTAATAVQGVFAIFAVAIQLMSKLIKVSAENAEAAREVTEALDNYRNALKALNEEAERASRNTIFGEDSFGLALTNLEVARERLTDLNRLYTQLQSKDWDMHNLGLGNAQYSKKQQDFIDSVNAKDAALVADMRTASQKFFGANKNIVTADLADFYNDNGKLDLERLKAWYELYGEYLSEEQKHIVNQLIEGWEVYYDSTEAATNYLKGIFGELGDDITNSIVDAFANGTDAAEAFRDSVSDIMRNFAADMVENMYITPLLEQAQKDVEAIWADDTLSHEQKLAAIAARMAELGRELNDTQDDVNASLDLIDKAGKGQGFDIFDGADRKGSTKSGIQASQDSIDELSGRATAIQSHTYALANGQKQLIKDSASILKTLTSIEVNTRELHAMRKDMASMRSDINTIATRGIKAL